LHLKQQVTAVQILGPLGLLRQLPQQLQHLLMLGVL
jgi:hypothetical protein